MAASPSAGAQPMTLDEIVRGAQERAEAAVARHDLGFGIESGVFEVPGGRLMDTCACVIYDGVWFCLGLSSAFVLPREIEALVRQGFELNEAVMRVGLSGDLAIGRRGGIVELLTGGRVDRLAQIKQAAVMALAHYERHASHGVRTGEVIATICSRQKDRSKILLPASKRYLGSHMTVASAAAQKEGQPLFVLSGKFGLIPGDEPVPYYDYMLTQDDAPALSHKLSLQLRVRGITAVRLYTKCKPAWSVYRDALVQACEAAGTRLMVRPIRDRE